MSGAGRRPNYAVGQEPPSVTPEQTLWPGTAQTPTQIIAQRQEAARARVVDFEFRHKLVPGFPSGKWINPETGADETALHPMNQGTG
jgi:hypothetical protein